MNDTDDTTKQLNEHTRAVYHQQHIRQGEDAVTCERLRRQSSEQP
jgi:hypothetical protein